MYQHTFSRLIGAIALSCITLATGLADSAAARRKPFSFGSSFNSPCSRANTNFVLTTETSDGRPILDADPSPNSGLFKGAVEQYSFLGEVENSGFFDFSVPCDEITRQIPTLDLITSINGSFVDFRLVSPDPYEERYLEVIIEPPDPSSEDPFPIVNIEERIIPRSPGTVANFNLVGLDFSQSDFEPVVALPPTFQKALVNSLDLLDFIEIEAIDALQANILHINLGRDSEAIEQIINHPVDVPEPTTTIALMIAGTLGWFGLKKK